MAGDFARAALEKNNRLHHVNSMSTLLFRCNYITVLFDRLLLVYREYLHLAIDDKLHMQMIKSMYVANGIIKFTKLLHKSLNREHVLN